eukprot:3253344-Pyramimonas_sp.AAC.1
MPPTPSPCLGRAWGPSTRGRISEDACRGLHGCSCGPSVGCLVSLWGFLGHLRGLQGPNGHVSA